MIVADNTLLCHFFLRSDLGSTARQVRERDTDWIVPPLWRSEFANVLVKAYWACPDPLELYCRTWDAACATLERCERQVDFHDAIRLGAENRVSAYDAQYVSLARKYSVPLVTEDLKLQRQFPQVAISMATFLGQGTRPYSVREPRAQYRTKPKRR